MFKCLKFSNSILYMDDTTLYIVGRNIKCLKAKLQSDINELSVWLKCNKLKLNVKKTKLLFFDRYGLSPDMYIHIDNESIENVRQFKFLGIIMDGQLLFKDHFNTLHQKLLKLSYVIRKLSNFVPSKNIRTCTMPFFTVI